MNIFISLSVIFWSLFPSLLSYTQNSPEPNKVHLQNVIVNGDLIKDTNNDNIPDGFVKSVSITTYSLNNGVFTFSTNVAATGLASNNLTTSIIGNQYYCAAFVKANATNVRLITYQPLILSNYTNTNQWQLLSLITTKDGTSDVVRVESTNTSFANAETKQFILYNVSQMKLNGVKDDNGVLFSSLTNQQIKAQIDSWVSQIPNGYNSTYYLSTAINDDYKWFSTGFVDKTGERDFLDYLGFFVWLAVPPISIYLIYKLMKGLIYE